MKVQAPRPSPQDPEVFWARLRALAPRAVMTPVLIGANVAVLLIMAGAGVDPMAPDVADLIQWGANDGPKTSGSQPWRLITSCFLHGGIIHLAFNMYALWQLGQLVERLYGTVGFTLLYLAAGVTGAMASVLADPLVISVGASGAIFGVFGGMVAYLMVCRSSVPRGVVRALRRTIFTFIAYAVGVALLIPGIDNAAHGGGLVGGLLVGAILATPLDEAAHRRRRIRVLVAAAIVAPLVAGAVVLLPEPAQDRRILSGGLRDAVGALAEFSRAVLETETRAITARRAGRFNPAEHALALEREVLPALETGSRRVEAIRGEPLTEYEASVRAMLEEFLERARFGIVIEIAGLREGDEEEIRRGRELVDEAQRDFEEAFRIIARGGS